MENSRMVLVFWGLIGLFSCENINHHKIDLSTDKYLSNIFSPTEIESFALMIDFVDSAVVAITNNKNEAEAYHDFFEIYGKGIRENKRISPFSEKEKFDFLESLDKGAFDAIWIFDTHIDRLNYRDTILTNIDYIKCLSINPFGRYIDYMEQVGNNDKRYTELHEHIVGMGDLSTSAGLWMVHDEFDFGKVEDRFLAAVYILRVEDSYETKLDRYFSKIDSTHNTQYNQ